MEMAVPVTQRPQGGADTGTYIISFVMPLRYTPDTLPEPLNPRIRLRKDSAKLM